MTDEELMPIAVILCKAYYIGRAYSKDYAEEQSKSPSGIKQWLTQARALASMGHSVSTSEAGGRITSADVLLRSVELFAENVKATLEQLEKEAVKPDKKAIRQWRFALNCFIGAPHKKGLLPDLKEAGPGAY